MGTDILGPFLRHKEAPEDYGVWGVHGVAGGSTGLRSRISGDDGVYLSVSVLTPVVFFVFACVMAVVSAVHSYLVVLYAGRNKVAKDVGFYYMANAGGRLVGTLCSGLLYQETGGQWGISVCLYVATGFLVVATVLSLFLKPNPDGRLGSGSIAGDQGASEGAEEVVEFVTL